MIYNFNLGMGWASSGVEYAQAYRARMLRHLGEPARFIFTDMFSRDPLESMTRNIGFEAQEIMWLYTGFTDIPVEPISFTLEQLKKTFPFSQYQTVNSGQTVRFLFPDDTFYTAYLVTGSDTLVNRVEIVSRGCLVRKDYYAASRIYSEYYQPLDGKAVLRQRRFYNRDGSAAYEEVVDGEDVFYRFPDRILCSKEELVGYFTKCLKLTKDDVVILDRTTGIGQAVLENAGDAHVGVVIHADHFSEAGTDEKHILWNNFYEYSFAQHERISFYITSTDAQNRLLREQFRQYLGIEPNVFTIPVGGLERLTEGNRTPFSLITASRLADEKHVDWLVDAVVQAKTRIPGLSLDIYGRGGMETELKNRIQAAGADGYIRLMGQQKLDSVYGRYEAYLSGSTSEGFGLTLMEAVGAGLPIIGFDVRYGNPTFIDGGRNGYLIPVKEHMSRKERVEALADCIVSLFTEADLESFHQHSYEKGSLYLAKEVEHAWEMLLNGLK